MASLEMGSIHSGSQDTGKTVCPIRLQISLDWMIGGRGFGSAESRKPGEYNGREIDL
jgi:hypothetical protein